MNRKQTRTQNDAIDDSRLPLRVTAAVTGVNAMVKHLLAWKDSELSPTWSFNPVHEKICGQKGYFDILYAGCPVH